jgi:two-component system nitrate/nitrite response regulator NarP
MSKVLIVSDQPVLLGGFQCVLGERGFDVATCGTPAAPIEATSSAQPDLVLMDLTAGLTFGDLTEVNGRLPGCPVVLWTESIPLDMVFRALEFGVRGIVERSSSPEHLADSLTRVAGGEMQIGFVPGRDSHPQRRQASLTPREREIVTLLRQGLRNKQIAADMGITEGTVKIYLFRLFNKLGVRNRFELAQSSALEQVPTPPRQGGMVNPSGFAPRIADAAQRQPEERHHARLI